MAQSPFNSQHCLPGFSLLPTKTKLCLVAGFLKKKIIRQLQVAVLNLVLAVNINLSRYLTYILPNRTTTHANPKEKLSQRLRLRRVLRRTPKKFQQRIERYLFKGCLHSFQSSSFQTYNSYTDIKCRQRL